MKKCPKLQFCRNKTRGTYLERQFEGARLAAVQAETDEQPLAGVAPRLADRRLRELHVDL